MLTRKDMLLISGDYFVILKKTYYYIEVMSKCTRHCWVIYKHGSVDRYPVWVYHKHRQQDLCYHLHKRTASVKSAIREIKAHDIYQSTDWKKVFNNLY